MNWRRRALGLDLLLTPVFASAVVLLVFNDRIAKQRWPGVITGKLSDIAGVAMVAIVLTALTRLRALGCAATLIGFAALKTSNAVAEAAVPLLGGVTRIDHTDLLALLVLLPLWRLLRIEGRTRAAPTESGSPMRVGVRTALKALALGAAVLAMSATSCETGGVFTVSADAAGTVRADTSSGTYASEDGGVSWRRVTVAPDTGPANPCLADGTCFELERRGVALVDDGTRTTEVALTDDEVERMSDAAGCGGQLDLFTSLTVAPTPTGEHVIVAMGENGVLHRAPDGTWSWVRVGDYGVSAGFGAADAPTSGEATGDGNAGAGWRILLGLTPFGVALAAIPIGVAARGSRIGVMTAVLSTLGLAVLLLMWAAVMLMIAGLDVEGTFSMVAAVVTVAVAVGGVTTFAVLARRRPPISPVPTRWPPPAAPPHAG